MQCMLTHITVVYAVQVSGKVWKGEAAAMIAQA
jgi:hypothetical protein